MKSFGSENVLDANARRILDAIESTIAVQESRLQNERRFPIDAMPVGVNEIALYRQRYTEALHSHIDSLQLIVRMIEIGGDAVAGAWADATLETDDNGSHPRSSHPRPDGDR
ncbi:hypothetical protein [Botrimarina mediterranea]|uniref:hypothetical protein n=1 Tax=Botrimarina mediterranea TaxID=2528022 RepID=UPI00118797A1|nr:hypothetical protein K2D_16940 [Planctomycetes bacterium K2D]